MAEGVVAAGVQGHAFAFDHTATRIGELDFQRNARERPAPVAGAHDVADIDGIARAIQTTIGKQIGLQCAAIDLVGIAADIEARQVQIAAVTGPGQEGQVRTQADADHGRLLFAGEAIQRRQRGMTGGIGVGGDQRFAIAGDHAHARASHGRALIQRLHEHLAAAIQRALDDDAEVGQHHQARVHGFTGVLGDGLIRRQRGVLVAQGAQRQQEHTVAVAAEELAEVDALVVRFGGIDVGQGDALLHALDQTVLTDGPQSRLLVAVLVELHQMVQLFRQHAADFQPQRRQIAGDGRDPTLAAQRQQRALTDEFQEGGILRYPQSLPMGLAQDEAAEGFQPLVDAQVEVAPGRRVVLEAVHFQEFALGRIGLQLQRLRSCQHGLIDLAVFPGMGFAPGLVDLLGIVLGQQPDLGGSSDVAIAQRHVEAQDEHLLGLEAIVVDQRRLHLADAHAVQRRQINVGIEFGLGAGAAECADHALANLQLHLAAVGWQLQRRRVDPGSELVLIVLHMGTGTGQRTPGAILHLGAQRRFQLGRVDRVAELQFPHGLLQIGILRILVELVLGDSGAEGRGVELQIEGCQYHRCGHGLLRIQPHRVVPPYRPIPGRLEADGLIVFPGPATGQRRFQCQSRRFLVDAFQRCRRRGEAHPQRRDGDR